MLKQRFKIALASANLKQVDWARMHKLSESGLSQLLNGKMKSRRLEKAMENFIHREFVKLGLTDGHLDKRAA